MALRMWAFIHSNWNSITNLRQQINMIQNPFSDILVEMLLKIQNACLSANPNTENVRAITSNTRRIGRLESKIPRPLQSDLATNTLVAILLELPKDLENKPTTAVKPKTKPLRQDMERLSPSPKLRPLVKLEWNEPPLGGQVLPSFSHLCKSLS